MIENFPCLPNFPSSKKVFLIINKKILHFFFSVKIIITLGYTFKFYYLLKMKAKITQEQS